MRFKVRVNFRKQNGVSLLIFFVILLFGTSSYLVLSSDFNKRKLEKNQKTMQALNEAKLAMIGWSVKHKNPGTLPCPEDLALVGTINEGSSRTTCNELRPIGRLPWKTLGIGDIRDGNGDKLWYAISSGYRSKPINLNTSAALSLNYQAGRALAIIFAAGPPLFSQKRINQTDIAQYLDLFNVSGTPTFLMEVAKQDFNDGLLVVTKDDLFNAVSMRVLGDIRGTAGQGGLVDFYFKNGFYPYADSNGDGQSDNMSLNGNPSYEGVAGRDLAFVSDIKAMLKDNGWPVFIDYQMNSARNEVNLKLGNHSIKVVPSP
jgi:hypothetical protein